MYFFNIKACIDKEKKRISVNKESWEEKKEEINCRKKKQKKNSEEIQSNIRKIRQLT